MSAIENNKEDGFNLFGFQIKRKIEKNAPESFVPVQSEDGGSRIEVSSGAAYNSFSIDLDPSAIRDEAELIRRYREISLVSDIDIAIDEITNELLIYDEYKPPLDIDFTEDFAKTYSEQTKEIIKKEFKEILSMMNFNSTGSDMVKSWYVDGRYAYHKVIDPKNPKAGITELRPIDVAKLKLIVEIKKEKDQRTQVDIVKSQDEYFLYSAKGFTGAGDRLGLKIAKDAVAYVTSGQVDRNTNMVLSYLHKSIRPMNQLRMMEDSEVIYRMGRAPQRRVFYIDTNGMNRTKGEQHIKDVMARYKNKQVYDASTGTVKDDKKHLSILEDFWLPRANGGKGTEITTLDGGGTLGDPGSISYYQNKLYQALNIPISRLQGGQSSFNMGRENEISRDEVKFSKFIEKLRRKLNTLFLDILKTQLILKGISSSEDWEIIKTHLLFNYVEDNFYAEIKESEMLKERMVNVQVADAFVGKYFSKRYIQREILKLTDEQVGEMDEENLEDEQLQQELQQKMMIDLGIDPNNPTGEEDGGSPVPPKKKTVEKKEEK